MSLAVLVCVASLFVLQVSVLCRRSVCMTRRLCSKGANMLQRTFHNLERSKTRCSKHFTTWNGACRFRRARQSPVARHSAVAATPCTRKATAPHSPFRKIASRQASKSCMGLLPLRACSGSHRGAAFPERRCWTLCSGALPRRRHPGGSMPWMMFRVPRLEAGHSCPVSLRTMRPRRPGNSSTSCERAPRGAREA